MPLAVIKAKLFGRPTGLEQPKPFAHRRQVLLHALASADAINMSVKTA